MTSPQPFLRVATYGVAIGIIDAVSGRTLQASPDPSTLFALLATAWVAYDLAEARRSRVAVPAALTLWAAYLAAFVLTAQLLVGWNNSAPWKPESTSWILWFAIWAVVVAIAATAAGMRAAREAATGTPVAKS